MKEKIKSIISNIQASHMRRTFYSRDKWMIDKFNLSRLSSTEIAEVNRVWPFVKANQKDLIWHKVYKKEYGFNPYFVTDYHLLYILRKTNPFKQVSSLENKAMFDVYFPNIQFPHSYIKSIKGMKWCNGNIMIHDSVVDYIINNKIFNFVIKPTLETGCGKSVKVVNLENIEDRKKYLSNLMVGYGDDYIIQEVLKQHSTISCLNPSSVNSCRVTTIFLNGNFYYSVCLKIGKKGSNVDNWHSSYFVGIDKEGKLMSKGYDNHLNPVDKTDNAIAFKGLSLPNYEIMINSIQEWHQRYFPQVGVIGWDVLIDDAGDVRVIEVNLTSPGNVAEQYASGTFFEDCHDDLVKLLK